MRFDNLIRFRFIKNYFYSDNLFSANCSESPVCVWVAAAYVFRTVRDFLYGFVKRVISRLITQRVPFN
jgi:hypothetical protein